MSTRRLSSPMRMSPGEVTNYGFSLVKTLTNPVRRSCIVGRPFKQRPARRAPPAVRRREPRRSKEPLMSETGSRSATSVVENGRASATRESAPPAREQVKEMQQRQRDEFGGLSWGSAFFGWLVAVGIATLLTALLSAAGAAVGLTKAATDTADDAGTVGIVGGVLLLVILLVGYYAGGYVDGRMSRLTRVRHGLGVWIIGLVVTVLLAAAGALLGAKYNVLGQLNLPRIPVDEGSLTTGGLIALAAIVIGTLLAAIAGGKAGTHFHRKD